MPNILSKIELPNGTVYDIKSYKTMSIPMGSVDSTSTSTAFTATIDGISELIDGVCVWLTNGVVTSAAGYTININGLGAKPVYRSNAAETASSTQFNVAYTVLLIYNSSRVSGGCWDYVYGYDADTTYSAISSSELTTGTATTLRTVRADYLKSGINSLIDTKIGTLDGTVSGTPSASKTLTAFSETDGKVSATFEDISITKSQVSDFPSTMTPSSHTHGNIQNGGTLQTDDVTIASGDKLIVTDSSNSNKIARTSLSFDGATANKCLTQKGTWESFTNNAGTVTSVKVGSTSYSPSSGVVSLPAYPTTLPASDTTSTYSSTGTAPVNGTAVAAALATLPSPMVFKGSLGTGGTITTLPTASSSNKGYVYKVITAGTYASQSAKIGDTFISDGSTWVLIPSGDEPSGTVTSITIKGTSPIVSSSSSAITTSGTRTISHADSGVTAGTYTKVTVNATGHVTDGANPTTVAGYGITDAVTNVAYDTTNKKFTKTVNGATSNIASLSTISIGSASAGTAIPADDITSWTTNTPTEVVPNTVVTGGTTTDIPNISKKTVVTGVTKKTVVTSASGATATVSGCTLTLTNGSFSTGDSVTVSTGDSVTVGTAIKAYTSLTTGDACTVTAGTAASLNYTAKSIPNISVASKTVATGFTTT